MILLDTQLNIVFQNLGSWLIPVMKLFSFLGTESFFILVIPAIFWCFDSSLGFRLGLVLLTTTSLNSFFKIVFHLPRPYWVDGKVMAYAAEPSFGFPSGHSQKAAAIWGMLGLYRRNRIAMLAAGFIILMIGISRLYLGVHFSTDVLAGWLIGFLILILAFWLDRPISNWVSRTSLRNVFLSAMGIAIAFLGISIYVYSGLINWQVPESWIQLASRGGVTINPVSLTDIFSGAGTWIGFIAGACWLQSQEKSLGKFRVTGTTNQKVWRYLIGIAGILFFWSGLSLIFPREETVTGLALRLFRYGLVGAWITGLAPYVFFRTGLAKPEKSFDVESTLAAQ